MTNPSDKSPNDQRSRNINPSSPGDSRSYRTIQKPAKPGTISDKEARDAARWVKENRSPGYKR